MVEYSLVAGLVSVRFWARACFFFFFCGSLLFFKPFFFFKVKRERERESGFDEAENGRFRLYRLSFLVDGHVVSGFT